MMARTTMATSNPRIRIMILERDGPFPCARLAGKDVKESIAVSFCRVFPEPGSIRDSIWQSIDGA
jgi:hypothetical protein